MPNAPYASFYPLHRQKTEGACKAVSANWCCDLCTVTNDRLPTTVIRRLTRAVLLAVVEVSLISETRVLCEYNKRVIPGGGTLAAGRGHDAAH